MSGKRRGEGTYSTRQIERMSVKHQWVERVDAGTSTSASSPSHRHRALAKRLTEHDEASSVVLFEPIKQFLDLFKTKMSCFPKPWTGLDVDEFMKIINRNARSLQTIGDPRRANGSAAAPS